MIRHIVLASFNRKTGRIGHKFEKIDLMAEPVSVTLGFRQIYRKCISAAARDTGTYTICWLGQDFTVEQTHYFEAIDTALSETDGDTFLIGFVLTAEQLNARTLSQLRVMSGLDEQGAIFDLVAALPGDMQTNFARKLDHSQAFPGLASIRIPDDYGGSVSDAVMMFSFFYVGKLILWRIRRDQADINISLQQKNFKEAIFLTAIQRSRIINVKRYQLTSNISNDTEIKKFADIAKKGLNLASEYSNDAELNTDIEQYLAALERLFTEENRKRIERGVAVFSFVAVPFTVLAAFLAMLTITLTEKDTVLRLSLHRFMDQGIWFLFGASIAIPTMTYAVTHLFDRNKAVSAHLGQFREKNYPNRSARQKPRRLKWLSGILRR